MMEIERKFLVKTDTYKTEAFQKLSIVQGYLNSHPERSVRIRIQGESGFITIKGKSNSTGTSRFEWEKKISLKEAEALLSLCESGVIRKTRYLISSLPSQHIFEVDEFSDQNKGLVVAEIELKSENENFAKPVWLGEEVTGKIQYYNAYLSKKPFCQW